MFRKIFALSLAATMLIVLAACNGADNEKAASSESATKPSVKVTEIQMLHWNQANINAVIDEINAEFQKEFPQYKIVYTKTEPDGQFKTALRARLLAGDVDIFPDLSGVRNSPKDWTPGGTVPYWQEYIDNGLIADLTGQPFISNYTETAIRDGGTYNDKVYGIPAGSVAMGGLFYNKKIFSDNGLKVPTTWSEFTAVCEALLAKKIVPIGLAGKDVWPLKLPVFNLQAQLYAGGDQSAFHEGTWKGTHKYNDPDAVEVLEKMKLIQDKYSIPNFTGVGYTDLPVIFGSGQVAMIADGSWDISSIEAANPKLDFGYFPLPANEKPVDVMAGKYDMTWFVADKGHNKEGALKWLEFFSRPEHYQKFVSAAGFLPTQASAKTDNKVLNEDIVPWATKLTPAYEIVMVNRPNIGETLAAEGVHTELLAPGGPFKSAQELADKQQEKWEAAKP
ncbi:ABC transporter substrate-binding protein [Cohnella abietis]|uniref:ABC transporter substrate-binding protein n=1 Tax=Cohnella abietis TaxID=2507935 RepID=A0A3T1DBT9_9BACL|nr:extracellular solute-binding protein [Cohnella abietis]BBI35611.1 ABC transporter substrate-binding protein [Cohnella abietis]